MRTDALQPAYRPSEPAIHALVRPIEAAVEMLRPNGVTPVRLRGLLGTLFFSHAAAPIYADIPTLIVPGLRALGIEAEIIPLAEPLDGAALPCANGTPIFGFAGEPFRAEDDEELTEEAEPEAPGLVAKRDRERTLARAGLLRGVQQDRIEWEEGGETHVGSVADFGGFACALILRPIGGRRRVRGELVDAINRAALFALAFPDRFLTRQNVDATSRSSAAEFLAEAAGRLRDPVSLRWRRAAGDLEAGDVNAAVNRLYDAMLRTLELPGVIHDALARPVGAPLTGMQRRELIYLARAGNRDLKVLAVHRLASAAEYLNALHTLEQLTTAPDPLVRATAARGLSADFADERR